MDSLGLFFQVPSTQINIWTMNLKQMSEVGGEEYKDRITHFCGWFLYKDITAKPESYI